jgi:hypothetical protein
VTVQTKERTAYLMATAKDRVADVTPYVKRALQDEELRESIRSAYATARSVYDELIGGRSMTVAATRVASDKEIQEQLRSAIDDLRSAAERIQGREEESRKGLNTSLLLIGITLGILFNPVTGPDTRRWLKDKIFGEEEEFGYGGGPNGDSA